MIMCRLLDKEACGEPITIEKINYYDTIQRITTTVEISISQTLIFRTSRQLEPKVVPSL